ncbi:MAG: polysaccharide biosynthesis/export family protein [Polyangiaceae bacterium]
MSARISRRWVVGCAIALSVSVASCASQGSYVWVDDLAETQAPDEYTIQPGDVIAVTVFGQDNMSTHARVRSDGRIALPFLGDVEVRGKSPPAVSRELEGRYKQYVVAPAVTVTVEESQPTSVSVLGEVNHPGVYTLDPSAGVLQGLAAAGGVTDYASLGSIFVVRRSPTQRIRFTYASLTQGSGRGVTFRLHAGDVVVVE